RHVEPTGTMQIVPLRLVAAVAVEDLDAVVLPVGDIDPALGVAADIVDDVELARIAARLAPRHEKLAVRREFVDAGIAVAIGDIDVASPRQRRVGATIERRATHIGSRLVGNADLEKDLAVEAALADDVK